MAEHSRMVEDGPKIIHKFFQKIHMSVFIDISIFMIIAFIFYVRVSMLARVVCLCFMGPSLLMLVRWDAIEKAGRTLSR